MMNILSAGKFLVLISALLGPLAVCADDVQASVILATVYGDYGIQGYDLTTGAGLGAVATTDSQAYGVTNDANGNIYAGCYFTDSIAKFDSQGNNLGNFTSPVAGIELVAVHGNYLYSAGYGDGRICRSSLDNLNVSEEFAKVASGGLMQMTWDRDDNLLVAVYNGNKGGTIQKVAPDGVVSQFATLGGTDYQPQGLAIDSNGYVYAADWAKKNIRKFSPTGADLGIFANYQAYGLAIDGNDNLYGAIYFGHEIHVWRPDGTQGSISTGSYTPMYLTIVPEPFGATVWLTLLGTTVAAVQGRRLIRRRAKAKKV